MSVELGLEEAVKQIAASQVKVGMLEEKIEQLQEELRQSRSFGRDAALELTVMRKRHAKMRGELRAVIALETDAKRKEVLNGMLKANEF